MPERALARVDTLAIERNCRVLKPSGAELCAVVKADGYGHGAEQAARAALRGGAGRRDDHSPAQLERFGELAREVRSRHPGVMVHAANSAATLRAPLAHFDMVRWGVGIYGLAPFQGEPAASGLAPALSIGSYVAA